jgi:hypothetical protein
MNYNGLPDFIFGKRSMDNNDGRMKAWMSAIDQKTTLQEEKENNQMTK